MIDPYLIVHFIRSYVKGFINIFCNKSVNIVLFSLLSFNTFATSKQQAIEIYNKIVQANHIVAPKLVFSPDKDINASSGRNITLNQGMLDATNVNELALVIGHELGHYTLKHRGSTPSREFDADRQGFYFAVKAGYNAHKGKEIFKKFRQKASKTHPHPKERYKRLP